MPSMFAPIVLLAEAAGLVTVGLVITWMAKYNGGFALDKSGKEFNLHPVFMVLGFLFFNANALMTYRILGSNVHRLFAKTVHFVLQFLGVICGSFGLACVVQFHNANKYPNLYSLHSWIGIVTFAFFCLQLILGFVMFLIMAIFAPTSTTNIRKVYLHLHVYGGVLIFIMAGATALLGTAEKISFGIKNYSDLPPAGVLANTFGVFITIFVALVCYILFNDNYKSGSGHSDRDYTEQINITQ